MWPLMCLVVWAHIIMILEGSVVVTVQALFVKMSVHHPMLLLGTDKIGLPLHQFNCINAKPFIRIPLRYNHSTIPAIEQSISNNLLLSLVLIMWSDYILEGCGYISTLMKDVAWL